MRYCTSRIGRLIALLTVVLVSGGCLLPQLETPTDATGGADTQKSTAVDTSQPPDPDTGSQTGRDTSQSTSDVSDDTSGSMGKRDSNGGGGDDASQGGRFASVKRIVEHHCSGSSCHTPGSPGGGNLEFPGWSPKQIHDTLLNTMTTGGTPVVKPNDAMGSAMFAKLNSGAMPKRGWDQSDWNATNFPNIDTTAGADIAGDQATDLIEKWINEGAPGP